MIIPLLLPFSLTNCLSVTLNALLVSGNGFSLQRFSLSFIFITCQYWFVQCLFVKFICRTIALPFEHLNSIYRPIIFCLCLAFVFKNECNIWLFQLIAKAGLSISATSLKWSIILAYTYILAYYYQHIIMRNYIPHISNFIEVRQYIKGTFLRRKTWLLLKVLFFLLLRFSYLPIGIVWTCI